MQVYSKAVLITGTSSGIGKACAVYLAKLGYRVFAGVRNEKDGEGLALIQPHQIVPLILDVTDQKSILKAVEFVKAEVGAGGLFALINNAGISLNGPLEYFPPDQLRRLFEVNVIGLLNVTQNFLPLLRQANGRVINISSISGIITFPFSGSYCASKYAVEALSDALRMELLAWEIPVSVIEPISIASDIWQKSQRANRELLNQFPEKGQQYYGSYMKALDEATTRQTTKLLSADTIAKVVAKILVTPKPKPRYLVGRGATFLRIFKLMPTRLRDRLIMSQLKSTTKS
jgi:NAD(P)-dependent dehydrogenase (short-subunit alcohol dehydrogenase family)